MTSHNACCGCWAALVNGFQSNRRSGRTYRRAKYNEREYSIEFENLIEEEDFYAPPQHAVSDAEKELLSKGKFNELLHHQRNMNAYQDEVLRQKEENVKLEDEAYIQAKREASKASRQALKKQPFDKTRIPNMRTFDSAEFSKWLSEEKIDITSPELDVEDFDSFLEKVKAKSAQALKATKRTKDDGAWEETLSQGLEATKIAGDALNALQPVELHAVSSEVVAVATVNTPRNVATNLTPETKVPVASSGDIETLPSTVVSSFKLVSPMKEHVENFVNDSFDDDDEMFVTANSEGGFEELLT